MREHRTNGVISIRPAAAGADNADSVVERFAQVKSAILQEYSKKHATPWIVAYSGGKDSTLLLHLVWEAMLSLPAEQRKRQIYVIGNDTLVESPLVINHLRESLGAIERYARKHKLPVKTEITEPCVDDTFWVNVIGRGYIPPTRNFRWCTDRMKIEPTNRILKRITRVNKRAVLLIGTRKSESQNRRRNMEKHGVKANKMNPHTSIENCRVFAPLADLTDNEVWMILMQRKPPWGGTHRRLITLYRNAGGGECPLVLSKADAPSCGTTSPRFGCWTCTVVAKDKSMRGLISAQNEESHVLDNLEKLADFREWLLNLREDNKNRMDVRRDGSIRLRADNSRVYGPFKMEIREQILDELRELEKSTQQRLISQSELEYIRHVWHDDKICYQARQEVERILSLSCAA